MRTRLSTHASIRARQRGISDRTVELLLQYGTPVYDHRGGCLMVFDKAARARVLGALGKAAAQMKFSAYAVLDASRRTVITLGHRTQRVREGA